MLFRIGMNMVTLQKLSLPDRTFNSIEGVYYRINDKVRVYHDKGVFYFKENGFAIFDTYMNAFSVTTWKYYANLQKVYLVIQGKGQFLLRLVHIRHGWQHRYLFEHEVELDGAREFKVEIPEFENLGKGILFPLIIALSEGGEIYDISYVTDIEPPNKVKLGIVITHFNRQKNVKRAIERLRSNILNRDDLDIDLIIVDNSKNLCVENSDRIKVIPNYNLGGSGGFMKGFLYLEENNYTHALFMDDDALTENEAIIRTYRIFQYTQQKKLATAGALHTEATPGIIYEKGALFEGICKPLKRNLNIEHLSGVLKADREEVKIDYGGWWFFAFRLSDVKYLAFPYFVRGDDILFSIVNKFKIHCPIGVYVLGEDFGSKESPLHVYLDIRYHIINSILKGDISLHKIIAVLGYLFLKRLLSYRYESCQAFILAIEHVLKGPEFFEQNVDISKIREIINSFVKEEKASHIDLMDYEFDIANEHENKIRRLFRMLTLNGFLLPEFMLKNKMVYQEKTFSANLSRIFRYKKVLYYNVLDKTGYILTHDKKKILELLVNFGRSLFKLVIKYPRLKQEYNKKLAYLTSREFWKNVFRKYD